MGGSTLLLLLIPSETPVLPPVTGPPGPPLPILLLLRRRRPEPIAAAAAAGGDTDILSDVRDRLEATGEFDGVHLSAPPEDWGRSGGEGAMAIVQGDHWEDATIWDNFDSVGIPRKLYLSIAIHVRDADPETRDRTLNRLTGVVQNALDGQALGGISYPDLTKIRSGRFQKARPPERVLVLTGECTYEVDGYGGHDVSE